jgi:hypothetical protein
VRSGSHRPSVSRRTRRRHTRIASVRVPLLLQTERARFRPLSSVLPATVSSDRAFTRRFSGAFRSRARTGRVFRCISGRVRASRSIEVGASRRVLPGVGRSPLGVGPSRPGHRVRRLRASPRVVVGSGPHGRVFWCISGRLRTSPRVSSFASFGDGRLTSSSLRFAGASYLGHIAFLLRLTHGRWLRVLHEGSLVFWIGRS